MAMETGHQGRHRRLLTSLFAPVTLLLLVSVAGWLTLQLRGPGTVSWWAVSVALAASAIAVAYLVAALLRLERRIGLPAPQRDGARVSPAVVSPQFVDSATGLPTRIWFDHTFAAEIARSRRYHHPLSLVVLDVDHLTRVKRLRGNGSGGRVLAAIAGILGGSLRRTDYLARIADGEFVVVLSETDARGAHNVAEKLRRAIAEHPFEEDLRITASIGIAAVEESDTAESFLQRGEAAAMTARRGGGNSVAAATF